MFQRRAHCTRPSSSWRFRPVGRFGEDPGYVSSGAVCCGQQSWMLRAAELGRLPQPSQGCENKQLWPTAWNISTYCAMPTHRSVGTREAGACAEDCPVHRAPRDCRGSGSHTPIVGVPDGRPRPVSRGASSCKWRTDCQGAVGISALHAVCPRFLTV